MEKQLDVIVPAFNEEEALKDNLPEYINFCKKNNFNLILVNDGSTDNTLSIAKKFINNENFFILNHKVNKGYGGAIKTGIKFAKSKYIITIDADGQHFLSDVLRMYEEIIMKDADMIVGKRINIPDENNYRKIGKYIIRNVAKMLMKLPIYDINSGMKIYRSDLAKKYIKLTPDSMAFSDIITLVFISQKNLVYELPINVKKRTKGKSTINTYTAFDTLMEIINIIVLFNPMRIFLPITLILAFSGFAWALKFILLGKGISIGAMLGIVSGILFFLLGLIAEQLSLIRKNSLD